MKKSMIVATLTAGFMSVPAFAGSWVDNVYVSADIGSGTFSTSNYAKLGGQTGASSPTATTERLAVGYTFNPYLAVEAGYTNCNSATAVFYGPLAGAPASIDGDSTQLAAVGTYPFNDKFAVFAKLGAAYDSVSSVGSTANGTNLMYGAGVKYNLTANWGVHAEYDDLGKTSFGIGNIDLQMASVGVSYNF